MKTGEIYRWVTGKARGHASRPKIHIFICEDDWQFGHTFLFVNSDDYGQDFKIHQADYDNCLTKPISFISCSDPVFYSTEELEGFAIDGPLGVLTPAHAKELFHHLAGHQVMEARSIKRCCNALAPLFAGK
jgi:hypothetical protein